MFININPNTILEPCECVEGALRAVLDQRLDPQQFVFEVVESERVVDADALVSSADQALYAAKESGRNQAYPAQQRRQIQYTDDRAP